jgi:ribonuclease VapC
VIVDTSVVIAIAFREPDAVQLGDRLRNATRLAMSAASFVEAGVVAVRRHGPNALDILRRLVAGLGLEIAPVTEEQALMAQDAYLRFGKGIHAAGLNFGDCFAYALATMRREPLLFKGTDFAKTDIPLAIP